MASGQNWEFFDCQKLLFWREANPPKPRKIKPPFRLFSYPPRGLRGLNFGASKRYHFKKGLKLVNKKVPFGDFSFSPLNPLKLNSLLTSGMKEKGV